MADIKVDVSEQDARNMRKAMGEPESPRYKMAQKIEDKKDGLLNKKLPNLKLFGGT